MHTYTRIRPVSGSTPPWDPWQIDADFIKTLSQWNEDHPETTLERVLEKMKNAVETTQPLFELIPDGAFPARGLVKALAHLVLLGSVGPSRLSFCDLMPNLCRK